MTDSTRDMLYKNMLGIRETIREYVRQIESGEYGDHWTVTYVDPTSGNEKQWLGVSAIGEYEAMESVMTKNTNLSDDFTNYDAELESADEPTFDETPISEYLLEVVDERGREYAVVLCTGGPHIEVVADGLYDARLVGYWSGETFTMHGDIFSTFLDYFIERD
jgi:hypothetical protein